MFAQCLKKIYSSSPPEICTRHKYPVGRICFGALNRTFLSSIMNPKQMPWNPISFLMSSFCDGGRLKLLQELTSVTLCYPMCLMLQENTCVKGHQTMTFKTKISSTSFMGQIQIWNHSKLTGCHQEYACLSGLNEGHEITFYPSGFFSQFEMYSLIP